MGNQPINRKSICHVEITSIDVMPRVWRSAEAAHQAGYEVTVIGYGQSTEYKGINFIGIEPAQNRLERVLHTSKAMVKLAALSDAYIVELHSPELLLYHGLLTKMGKKVVFNSHEFYGMQILRREYIPKFLRNFVSRLYIHWEKGISRSLSGIIYPCTVRGKNPFDCFRCESYKIENYSAEIKASIDEKVPRTAIYAGSLSEDRGCTTMVDVFNAIDGKLFLAGAFSSENYKKFIMDRANPDKVVYLGVLSREELFKYYAKTAVGLSLLKKEGQYNEIDNLSTKMYEFMSCSMPIVASDMDFAQKVNSKYEFGILVDPNDTESIKNAIETLFTDEELMTRLGKNGKRAIDEEFNWKKEKIKLLSLYDNLAE